MIYSLKKKAIEDKGKENGFQIPQGIKHEGYSTEQEQKTKTWQGVNTSILIIPSSGLNSLLKRKRGSDWIKNKEESRIYFCSVYKRYV